MKNSKHLPSIQTLFSDSWRLFSSRLLNLILFNLIGWLMLIGWMIVCGIIFVISGVGLGVFTSFFQSGTLDITGLFNLLPILLIEGFILIIGFALIGALMQVGTILILNDGNVHISFADIFRKSFKFILPLFITGLLASVFIIGGFFVLVIPALIFGFLFSFYPFEVLLSGKKGLEAIKSSVAIVKTSFWQIVFRIFIIWALLFFLTLATRQWYLITMIIHIAGGWFSLCYIFILYKEAKKAQKAGGDLKWITIISTIGWIIAILGIFGLGNMLSNNYLKMKNTPEKLPAPIYQGNSKTGY